MPLVASKKYRKDIDSLRAISVLAVIFFHFGFVPYGYLGVDVFFVISGYLITGIILSESENGDFSIKSFYLRRIRRIIPLVLFASLIALIIGIFTMLPDDLENLSQSVIATNFSANNILQAITTRNYWDVVNEFKPLMHTWSLGIEEQYYFIYPFIFLLAFRLKAQILLPVIIFLGTVSLIFYLSPFVEYKKFYYLQFRFFELAAGGIAAIALGRKQLHIKQSYASVFLLLSLLLLLLFSHHIAEQFSLLLVTFVSVGILILANDESPLGKALFENSAVVFLGKISFSLYIWHQIILSFTRYIFIQELTNTHYFLILIATILASALSYFVIEKPFRNKKLISNKLLFSILVPVFIVTNTLAFYLYLQAGVIKDVPELDINRNDTHRNIHSQYNDNIRALDLDFISTSQVKVLVIGNSFARDWANVLLESEFKDELEVSYIFDPASSTDFQQRFDMADVVFWNSISREAINEIDVPLEKIWIIGSKNFGINNGYFYNNRDQQDYRTQRTNVQSAILRQNASLSEQWGERYLNLLDKVSDEEMKVPVFTPEGKFISQDTRHFTQAGAQYFAMLFRQELEEIIETRP